MKRVLSWFLVFSVVFSSIPIAFADGIEVSAASAVLINAGGEILWAKNENEKRPVASTTKIMTALIACEEDNLYEDFEVDAAAITVEGTSMGLKVGDKASLYDLIVGMLLSSGNDAANAAAVRIAGSQTDFSELMNKRASEIGMKNTNFVTPSGLHHENHYSTAYDMALLGKEALQNGLFRSVCSSKSVRIYFGENPTARTLYNHNKLLTLDGGYIGIKTGYTKKAGRCLVSACERNGQILIAVTLSDKNDWEDHVRLYDYGFSLTEEETVSEQFFEVAVTGGEKASLNASAAGGSFCYVGETLQKKVYLPSFIYAPVKKGNTVGKVVYYSGDREICVLPITASEDIDVKEKPPSVWERIVNFFRTFFKQE